MFQSRKLIFALKVSFLKSRILSPWTDCTGDPSMIGLTAKLHARKSQTEQKQHAYSMLIFKHRAPMFEMQSIYLFSQKKI